MTKTFCKETAANTLLLATSHHPRSLVQGIPVGQFLKTKRNCSREDDFETEAQELYGSFRERGYSHKCIRRAKKIAIQAERKDLNKTRSMRPKTQQQAPIRIISKYRAQWNQVKSMLSYH